MFRVRVCDNVCCSSFQPKRRRLLETEGRELNPRAPGYNPSALGQNGLPLGPGDLVSGDLVLPHLLLADAPAAAAVAASAPTAGTRRSAALTTSTEIVKSWTYQVVCAVDCKTASPV